MKTIATTILTVLFCAGLASAQSDPQSVITKPRPVQTEEEFKPHLGLIVGVSQPEGSGQEAADLGIDFGYQAYIPFSVGAEYIHSQIDDGAVTRDRDTVWLKGTYNFGGTIPVIGQSYAGVAVGAAFRSDGTSAAIAPVIGFDIPLSTGVDRGFISLGANARYSVVADSELDALSFAGVAKYWF